MIWPSFKTWFNSTRWARITFAAILGTVAGITLAGTTITSTGGKVFTLLLVVLMVRMSDNDWSIEKVIKTMFTRAVLGISLGIGIGVLAKQTTIMILGAILFGILGAILGAFTEMHEHI
ncbi:MAG TPA: hypothetical protein VLL52_12160 [Anaerolineae bacterium]|nr:hypothetical protein [Anaerolineae bacterium]